MPPPASPLPSALPLRYAAATLAALLVAGCASPGEEAVRQARMGRYEQAYATLEGPFSQRGRDSDGELRTERAKARDQIVVRMLSQAELAMAAGRIEEAMSLLARARELDPDNVRLASLSVSAQRALRDDGWMQQARRAFDEGRFDEATRLLEAVLKSQPGHQGARALMQQLRRPVAARAEPPVMAEAYQKPVSLEFREAQLRQVFESLARSSGVNFVFDKDVRTDAKVTVFLRSVSLDEALRVILATQQLDRKLLNDTTILVFPNTPAKQREHQELVTRTLYLANADVKQALNLVKTMTKTRDIVADERLNALVVRDVPEVVAQVERLLATIDLREPEVMLAVEVMEIASDRIEELGVSWPERVQYGIPNATAQVPLDLRDTFRTSVANPALLLNLRGINGATNLLANPTIRARNREKAKVQIGDKLPIFTTTATANVGVSASVNYVDVGLKLEFEPTVLSDGEVRIGLQVEVSNLAKEIAGPAGSVAYQIGTRMSTTALRLRDGETQVLAGLISDEDRRRSTGVPGLSELPLVGRLFGVKNDTRNKTEIVMLITPRVIHGLNTPSAEDSVVPSGTDALPGAAPLRLRDRAAARVGPASATGRVAAARASGSEGSERRAEIGALVLASTDNAAVGETVSVTLGNRSPGALRGELEYDPSLLQAASGTGDATPGRLRFDLAAQEETVFALRVLPAAAGQTVGVVVSRVDAAEGRAPTVEGAAMVRVRPRAP